MYLVNPLYFISNVIYIKPEKRYILIDKPCWNTMVRLIFKGRRPTIMELREFKELCYQTYVIWMETKLIDYKSFNAKISQYQLDREDFKKWVKSHESEAITTEPVVEVDLNDNTFLEEEFIMEEKSEELDLTDEQTKLLGKVTEFKKYEEDVKSLINYNLSLSPQHKSLVDLIGYGKVLSLARILVQTKALRFITAYQEKFLLNNLELISNALKLQGITLWYHCRLCNTINTHEHAKRFDMQAFRSEHDLNSVIYYYKQTPIKDLKFKIQPKSDLDYSHVAFAPAEFLEHFKPIEVSVFDKLSYVGLSLYVNIQDEGSLAINCKVDMDLYEYFYQFYMMKYVRETFYDHESVDYAARCLTSWISRTGYFNRYVYEMYVKYQRFFKLDEEYFLSTFGIDRSCITQLDDYYEVITKALEEGPVENPFNRIMNPIV